MRSYQVSSCILAALLRVRGRSLATTFRIHCYSAGAAELPYALIYGTYLVLLFLIPVSVSAQEILSLLFWHIALACRIALMCVGVNVAYSCGYPRAVLALCVAVAPTYGFLWLLGMFWLMPVWCWICALLVCIVGCCTLYAIRRRRRTAEHRHDA